MSAACTVVFVPDVPAAAQSQPACSASAPAATAQTLFSVLLPDDNDVSEGSAFSLGVEFSATTAGGKGAGIDAFGYAGGGACWTVLGHDTGYAP